jgi:hypothetical protein
MATIYLLTFMSNMPVQSPKLILKHLSVISGSLPARARGLVIEWAAMHQEELRDAFQKAANMQAPGKIDPLP